MHKPKMEKLTKSLIEGINPNEIIYAEVARGGAMGNAGGIILYLIIEKNLICYETDIFTDEEVYNQAKELLLKYQDQLNNKGIKVQENLFDFFYGGMGNYVFVNKNKKLEIGHEYFIFKNNNIEYQILPTVPGVFNNVVYEMKKPKSDETI